MEQEEKLLADGELYAIVEVMGHNTFAGRVREQVIGGSAFIRVDVPELPERREAQYGREVLYPGIPAFTKIVGAGSIYAITPCSEDVARREAERRRTVPAAVLDVSPRFSQKALAAADGDDEEDEEEDDEDLEDALDSDE